MTGTPVLEVRELSRSFGAVRAVDGVSFTLAAASLTSIIGPNGAGKTTLYHLISGQLRPDKGRVLFRGEDLTGLAPHEIAARGLGRSFQVTNVFPGLSLSENVRVALIAQRGVGSRWFASVDTDVALREAAGHILEQVGLERKAEFPARSLSHGDRRVLELAIVLALEPELILLDEPTAGTNPHETQRIVALIRQLQHETGKTFVLTEHDMKVVFAVSERIIVMHQGRILADGRPEEIRGDAAVRRAYLGGVAG